MAEKIAWKGRVLGVQPRIRLSRSFDQRQHTYLGYSLRITGIIGDDEKEFLVGIGKGAQAKNGFQAGMEISGECLPVMDKRTETVEFYKASKLKILSATGVENESPPWFGLLPALEVYRERGHRRLSARRYTAKCQSCIWGCKMAVEMIIDQWNPSQVRWRTETFCYGPKSCAVYDAGPNREVLGRKGMKYTEEDWVDEDATSHREMDD